MKTTITLYLVATLCGFTVAYAVKRHRTVEPNKFDAIIAQKETQQTVQEILLNNTLDWQKVNMFLSLTRKSANDVIDMKMKEQLENVRLAVQNATEEGRDAEYCFKDAEDKLKALQQDAETKFTECANASMREYAERYSKAAALLQAGNEALKAIKNIYDECYMVMWDVKSCLAEKIEVAKQRVESFNANLKLLPTYRNLVLAQMREEYLKSINTQVNKTMEDLKSIQLISKTCVDGAE